MLGIDVVQLLHVYTSARETNQNRRSKKMKVIGVDDQHAFFGGSVYQATPPGQMVDEREPPAANLQSQTQLAIHGRRKISAADLLHLLFTGTGLDVIGRTATGGVCLEMTLTRAQFQRLCEWDPDGDGDVEDDGIFEHDYRDASTQRPSNWIGQRDDC